MSGKLAGKSAWVVGASSGIGAAVATQLKAEGATVAISARNQSALEQVAAGGMQVLPLDIEDSAAVLAAAHAAYSAAGRLDYVIVAAGYWKQDQFDRINVEELRRHVDINLIGVANVINAAADTMAGTGKLVVISSVAGYRGIPGSLAYGATKAAQLNLLESLRIGLAPSGLKLQVVSPGFVETPMTSTNTFPMPFIITAEEAAVEIVKGIQTNKPELVFPWQMALLMRAAKLVPQRLWFRIFARAGRQK